MTMGQQRDTYAGPMVDGQVVVAEAETAFRAGQQAKVAYLIGANNREFGFMAPPAPAVDGMLARFGAEKDKVLAAYDPEGTGNKGEVEVGLISDGAMVEPARLMARLATAAGQPTYEYRFSYVASSIRRNTPGAPRGFGAAPAVAGPARPLTAFLPRGRRSPPVRASSARWPVLGRGPRKARAPVAMRQRRRPRS